MTYYPHISKVYPTDHALQDALLSVIQAIEGHGIRPTRYRPQANGKLERFHIEGDKAGSLNGWCIVYPDNPLTATFGNWKTNQRYRWTSQGQASSPRPAYVTPKPTLDPQLGHTTALKVWESAKPAKADHPYLTRKQVQPYGIKQIGRALLIPVSDGVGTIHGLQTIDPLGQKAFTKGTRKKGHYHLIGQVQGRVLGICEGYATGASIHQALGIPVAIGFDAANLRPVCQQLKETYPFFTLVAFADNDHQSQHGNTGIEAAQASSAHACLWPEWEPDSPNTDWNDYHQHHGIKALAQHLGQALEGVNHA